MKRMPHEINLKSPEKIMKLSNNNLIIIEYKNGKEVIKIKLLNVQKYTEILKVYFARSKNV